jgi:hypothetical protein
MKTARITTAVLAVALVTAAAGSALSAQPAQNKYTLKVPGTGLWFEEFRGYESWQTVSVSWDNGVLAVIVANPLMIDAYQMGMPGNGQPFPDGAKMAKIHWVPKTLDGFPSATVPGTLANVDFMEKDSKRFADSGGWGWAVFEYDNKTSTFRPGTLTDKPPQANDAKCGFTCHTGAKAKDYVFTEYGGR